MIFVLSCIIFYIGGLMAQTYSGPAIDIKAKPVMCSFKADFDPEITPKIGVECFPCECEIILYESFEINNMSVITVETELLKQVVSLKPTIVVVHRKGTFTEWDNILKPGPDSYKKDAEVLCKFANQFKILGFELTDISPNPNWLSDAFTPTVMENIPGYLKLLKFSESALVGVRVYTQRPILKNPCVTDFASMNGVVDYYEICTFVLDRCEPKLSMLASPIEARKFGQDYHLGMEEVTGYLKETEVDYAKVYYVVDIYIKESTETIEYLSYHQVCTADADSDLSYWCIPQTKDYFAKGEYIKKENCGLIVMYVQLDDVNNECGCGSFIGFKNTMAGYTGGSVSPCPKFDVGVVSA